MQRKTLLALALVTVAVLALALLYFLLQPKTPTQPTQPAQPIVNATKPQQAQNATQAQPQPRQPTIIAKIDVGKGGRVLVNGSETVVWNSTKPFKLELEAVPDRCMALDHWLVNRTAKQTGTRLSLTIAGNTTISAVFARALYVVAITANATGAEALVNGTPYRLPASLAAPACSLLVVEPLETPLLKPLNTTLAVAVESDANITLRYWAKTQYPVQVLINGKPQYVEARDSPFFKGNGTVEMQGDWIHIKGSFLLYIYIPWNLTHVVIEAKLVSGNLTVWRFCEWGANPFAYGRTIAKWSHIAEFVGCKPKNYPFPDMILGRRHDHQLPGALLIDLVDGEAWLKIEASP